MAVLTSMCLYAVKQASAQQAKPPAATAVADIQPLQIRDTHFTNTGSANESTALSTFLIWSPFHQVPFC